MRLDLTIGHIMKKIFLLPFCISCVCGIPACSNHAYDNQEEIFISDEDAAIIDATTKPNSKCGIDGISCNENALVNYTRTEADFREYGERTRRDHLYTQAGIGNNLTASVRPTIEDDIVVAGPITTEKRPHTVSHKNPQMFSQPAPKKVDDGAFKKTATRELEKQPIAYHKAPQVPTEKLGQSNNLKPVTTQKYSYEVVCEDGECTKGQPYEVVCNGDTCTKTIVDTKSATKTVTTVVCNDNGYCEKRPQYKTVCDEECEDIVNADNNVITSEFTEASFDIADYIQPDEEEITFTEIGNEETIVADIDINEIKISDDTVLTWEAEEGENLRELLTKWSAMAGWKLLWQTNRNYILSAGVMFKGKFADVSSALIRAFARARPAPIATYYKGNRVIVVETMENENAY